MKTPYRATMITTLIGIAAGFAFPIISTLLEVSWQGLPLNLQTIIMVQQESKLLWVIDLAPLVIGFLALLIGLRQDRLQGLNESLQEQIQVEKELKDELDNLNASLNEDIQKSMAQYQRHANFIQTAAEIGKATTSIYQFEELLNRVVNLISERFGFYQVGIFLLDERNEFAVLQAASSEGGKSMLARQHRLRVGSEGIVGFVTSQGQARIALDVGEDAVFFDTPELPQTHSEMALPLYYGGRIFGALDIQSEEANAFSEEDIASLTVLADQVSIAINNARLFSELQESLEAERQAFGEISRRAWQNLIQRSGNLGYTYTGDRVFAVKTSWPDEMVEAFENGAIINTYDENRSISVPVIISNQPVGVIRLKKPDRSVNWTDDEIDLIQELTDRLGQALESARVYQASQRQAIQEQMTTEISAQLRQTLDIDTVLKTAARELGDAFNAKEVVIRMATDE